MDDCETISISKITLRPDLARTENGLSWEQDSEDECPADYFGKFDASEAEGEESEDEKISPPVQRRRVGNRRNSQKGAKQDEDYKIDIKLDECIKDFECYDVLKNYDLLDILTDELGESYFRLIRELKPEENHYKLEKKINRMFNEQGRPLIYFSRLHAGLCYIKQTERVPWSRIFNALQAIKRYEVLKELFRPENLSKWKRLCLEKSDPIPIRTSFRQPVESVDTREASPANSNQNSPIKSVQQPTSPTASNEDDSGIVSSSTDMPATACDVKASTPSSAYLAPPTTLPMTFIPNAEHLSRDAAAQSAPSLPTSLPAGIMPCQRQGMMPQSLPQNNMNNEAIINSLIMSGYPTQFMASPSSVPSPQTSTLAYMQNSQYLLHSFQQMQQFQMFNPFFPFNAFGMASAGTAATQLSMPVTPMPSNSSCSAPMTQIPPSPVTMTAPSRPAQQLLFQPVVNQNFANGSGIPNACSNENALANAGTDIQAQVTGQTLANSTAADIFSTALNISGLENQAQIVPLMQNNEIEIARNCVPQLNIPRMRNNIDNQLTVLVTYSRDAEAVAQKLIRVLWNANIFGIIPRVLKDVNGLNVAERIHKTCKKAKYIVPIISPQYIVDIGAGDLLSPDVRSRFDNLNDENDDHENSLWTVNIYDHYVINFFNNGARNWKVYPVHLPEVPYKLRLNLHTVLHCSRKLFDDVHQLIRALKQ